MQTAQYLLSFIFKTYYWCTINHGVNQYRPFPTCFVEGKIWRYGDAVDSHSLFVCFQMTTRGSRSSGSAPAIPVETNRRRGADRRTNALPPGNRGRGAPELSPLPARVGRVFPHPPTSKKNWTRQKESAVLVTSARRSAPSIDWTCVSLGWISMIQSSYLVPSPPHVGEGFKGSGRMSARPAQTLTVSR